MAGRDRMGHEEGAISAGGITDADLRIARAIDRL
jgi:pterin-4a-carbinolamine dehydratase